MIGVSFARRIRGTDPPQRSCNGEGLILGRVRAAWGPDGTVLKRCESSLEVELKLGDLYRIHVVDQREGREADVVVGLAVRFADVFSGRVLLAFAIGGEFRDRVDDVASEIVVDIIEGEFPVGINGHVGVVVPAPRSHGGSVGEEGPLIDDLLGEASVGEVESETEDDILGIIGVF